MYFLLRKTQCLLFTVVLEEANGHNLTPGTQETSSGRWASAFIHWGARKLLRTGSTMPGLVRAAAAERPDGGSRSQPQTKEVNPASPDPRNVSCRGPWSSRRSPVSPRTRTVGFLRRWEQMRSVLPARMQASLLCESYRSQHKHVSALPACHAMQESSFLPTLRPTLASALFR